MAVPRLAGAVPELDEAHAAFEQPPRDERLPGVNAVAVHLADRLRLFADVEGVGGIHLHAVGQFERLDAGFQPRVLLPAALLVFLVELLQQVELLALFLQRSRYGCGCSR